MKRKIRLLIWLIILFLLIMDNKTMQYAVRDGIELCLWTLIPTLFPFMILTSLLIRDMDEFRFPGITWIERLLKLPGGFFPMFLLGLLGGYPVGAKCICEAVRENRLSANDSKRMLCFCSNAGPSFIFGLGLSLFDSIHLCWQIWLCQILSAIILAVLMPGISRKETVVTITKPFSVSYALHNALESLKTVCGWVIFFRVLMVFLDKLALNSLPNVLKTGIYGVLELANGCCFLDTIQQEILRFVLFSMFLGFGGLCVCMQTRSIAESAGVDSSLYPGAKMIQGLLAGLLAYLCYRIGPIIFPLLLLFIILVHTSCNRFLKNTTGFLYCPDV